VRRVKHGDESIQGFAGETQQKETRATYACKDNIKMGLEEIRREGVHWIRMAQEKKRGARVNAVMTPRTP